jgi:succinate dehydrogenase hydrophobic anchor subunit
MNKLFSDISGIGLIFFVLLIIALVIIAPFLVIWSLNTLFPVLAIPTTFETWSAIVLIHAFLHSTISLKK